VLGILHSQRRALGQRGEQPPLSFTEGALLIIADVEDSEYLLIQSNGQVHERADAFAEHSFDHLGTLLDTTDFRPGDGLPEIRLRIADHDRLSCCQDLSHESLTLRKPDPLDGLCTEVACNADHHSFVTVVPGQYRAPIGMQPVYGDIHQRLEHRVELHMALELFIGLVERLQVGGLRRDGQRALCDLYRQPAVAVLDARDTPADRGGAERYDDEEQRSPKSPGLPERW